MKQFPIRVKETGEILMVDLVDVQGWLDAEVGELVSLAAAEAKPETEAEAPVIQPVPGDEKAPEKKVGAKAADKN